MSNTESDVFRMGKTGPVYYLVAGRWFSAPDFTGPWTFATPTLPADFKKIPLEHARSRVLASVPGTDQAAEAVLLAQIPQTARVNKKEAEGARGRVPGRAAVRSRSRQTTVQRAVNTDKDIFKVGDLYYMCYQGVWFVGKSADRARGKSPARCPRQIYQIPVSSPAHHVTYVTIEDDDDDEWVTFAAAAGYTGMMVAWGCTVWGTGWYYPPYYGYGGYYPYYYPHFPTYGYSAWYNPWTGAYGRSAGVYGPYGGAGVGARYNPRTGTYARGAAAYGPYGARGVAQAYNPRTGTYARDAAGVERLRQLGIDRGAARRRLGEDQSLHQPADRQRRRARSGPTKARAVTRRGPDGGAVGVGQRRQRLRRQRRQRLSARGRHLAEVRQRRLVEHRPAADGERPHADRPIDDASRARHGRHDGSQHDGSAESRFRRAPRRAAAHQRLRQLPQRQRHARHRQLSRRRRRRAGGGGGGAAALSRVSALTETFTRVCRRWAARSACGNTRNRR